MKTKHISGHDYHLPSRQTPFQEELYVHLIDWKWEHLTKEAGFVRYHGKEIRYDAVFPKLHVDQQSGIYEPARAFLQEHIRKNPFRLHRYFSHIASSQAANVNLFLPILHHSAVVQILQQIKPDFASLATDQLDHGYRFAHSPQ